MASQPPPEPNRSVDLKAAKSAAGASYTGNDSEDSIDIQTDGGVLARPISTFPSNIQRGLPPINPARFTQYTYVPHMHNQQISGHGAHIFNITNSHNVQIGRTNIMNINLADRKNTFYPDTDSSSSDEEDDQLAIEDSKLDELRKCEREISNIELQDIAQHVGLGWRRLVRFLGLQDYDVDEVYEDYGNQGLEEVVYQLLKRWKSEVSSPTVSEVLYQLQRCDMGHLAKHLRDGNFQYTDDLITP